MFGQAFNFGAIAGAAKTLVDFFHLFTTIDIK